MKMLIIIFLLFFSGFSWGYANFIGHGYTSCINCHFNPFGNGQLTDYGRAVSATAISSRTFYPKSWDEEKIAYTSGFLFRQPKQKLVRTQINYRGFSLVTNPGSSSNEEREWINMQFDARMALRFGEKQQFLFAADYGKVPIPSELTEGESDQEYRSRNLYLGYRLNSKFGLYAGLMDKVYGLRVIEHIAFSRINPQITQNDQTYGVAGHFLDGEWEGGVHAFVGNYYQDPDYRMKGASAMVERTIFNTHRVGASFLNSKNDYLTLTSYAIHGRFNLKEGSSLLAELGQTEKSPQDESSMTTARYGLLQTYLRPFRGFYVLANIEYLKNDISSRDYIVRWGPGLQYFPIQRIELRADIYDTRNIISNTSIKDSWMYLLQTHVWL
jgi:hypothetical protein